MSTIKILEQLVKEFPRKDLKLSQVFALDAAKEHLKSKARLTDRVAEPLSSQHTTHLL